MAADEGAPCSSASVSAARSGDDWANEPDDAGRQVSMTFYVCTMARSVCACSVLVSKSSLGSSDPP